MITHVQGEEDPWMFLELLFPRPKWVLPLVNSAKSTAHPCVILHRQKSQTWASAVQSSNAIFSILNWGGDCPHRASF